MSALTVASQVVPPDQYLRLAREIAADIRTLDDILQTANVTAEQFADIKEDPKFQALLASEIEAWAAATNTAQRTQLKAAIIIEEWLPEAHARLHDPKELLNAKTELAKLVARIGGAGMSSVGVDDNAANRFSVTINLGSDASLKIEKEISAKVIDGEATEVA